VGRPARPLVVYRAQNEQGGWCWTTDRKLAESCLEGLGRTEVAQRQIAKAEALAYITQYGESDVGRDGTRRGQVSA
jgi:hypothetical protein